MNPSSVARRRLLVALVVSTGLVLSAPFVGVVRGEIRKAFPEQFSLIINGMVGAALLAAVLVGLSRIREHRMTRYAAMAMAFVTGATFAGLTGSPDPAVRAVEHFHFVQFGIITLLFYRTWRDRADCAALAMPIMAAFIVGIAEEAFQWFIPARVGELRDVWLNGVAIGCGLLFAAGIEPPVPFTVGWRPGSRRLASRLLAAAVLTLAAFIHTVHLGQEIHDPEIGVFDTRFSAERLAALSAERTEQWKTDPPETRPPRLSREDQYMTEGLQHVQARNTAWDAGDAKAAWRENLILERYFQPVLDTPSYVSPTGHRWGPDHRADASERAKDTVGQPFTSAAYPYPLFYWSPRLLWVVALLAAGALLLL
ncbi:MAG: VanZ family protein [Acidobacteriota bacterium]